jgi:hypothetical protein
MAIFNHIDGCEITQIDPNLPFLKTGDAGDISYDVQHKLLPSFVGTPGADVTANPDVCIGRGTTEIASLPRVLVNLDLDKKRVSTSRFTMTLADCNGDLRLCSSVSVLGGIEQT